MFEVRRLLKWFELDRAVAYAIALRIWQIVSGPVSILLISKFFSEELQGYYYTFGSILTLQMFFELGLATVLVNLVAHEWAHLRIESDGSISGDSRAGSRLVSLMRFVDAWYSICALLFVFGAGLSGVYFFREHDGDVAWRGPWWALVVVTGLSLRLVPRIALLEGCHRMADVNAIRCWQAITGNLAVWTALVANCGLWTVVVSGVVRLLWESWLVHVRFGEFHRRLKLLAGSESVSWREDVWPLQWRIAIQGLGLWTTTNLFNPVMFHYHGAAVAGQMGMTWSLITAVQAMGGAWIVTRVPVISELVAHRQFERLNRLLLKLTLLSTGFLSLGASGVLVCLAILGEFAPRLAARLLPIHPTAIFFAAITVNQVLMAQAYNIRAHRRDPLWLMATIVYLVLGLMVWYWGERAGPVGAAWAYFLVLTVVYAPLHTWIWLDTKRIERELNQSDEPVTAD